MKRELKIAGAMIGVFLAAYFLPLGNPKIQAAILQAFGLLQWYVRNHTLACVLPALFIAGALITFLSQASVIYYLGPRANKTAAYAVASVSGAVLAVCSCSVLPMFAGIYRLGAGLGPATAFLYSGPAINILAIFLTARVLGFSLGAARAAGAVLFAVVIGVLMALIFRRAETERYEAAAAFPEPEKPKRPAWKTGVFLACMIGFLVFSDWYNPGDVEIETKEGDRVSAVLLHEMRNQVVLQLKEPWRRHKRDEKVTLSKAEITRMEQPETWVLRIYRIRWWLAGFLGLLVALMTGVWFERREVKLWFANTWEFAKLLVPLLFGGVFVVGFFSTLLPEKYVAALVGDNSFLSNLVAGAAGAFWYFATLTEIPICQALGDLGMHRGPMLTLLLAGPAVSLPNILVIGKILGWKKCLTFCLIVVSLSACAGMLYGALT